ncbi:MAG TPA: type VI secretion system lipoprotein TssJ [Polyangia bacterium]|nr:type VI secretion system lipoprotein TssJ [Polyangia bacterium]
MALLMAALAACSHSSTPPAAAANAPPAPCPSPEPLRLNLRASAHLNLSERGEPLATVVRVYQLKGTGKISVASFDDLLDHDKDALGEDFVAMQELTVNPGATLDPPLVRSPEATHVAVVALFRKPASTTWRTIEKLPPPDPQYCHPASADKDKDKDKDKKSPPPKDPTLHVQLDESRITTTPSS